MSDDLAAEFERRMLFLIDRDGVSTYTPSRELTIGALSMSVGANSFGKLTRGGMGIYYEVCAHDSIGWVYYRHFVNGSLKQSETDLERIKHYMPMLQKLMPLEDLANV